MTRITVSVSENLIEKLRKDYPEINWAEVARQAIVKKLAQLEKLEERRV